MKSLINQIQMEIERAILFRADSFPILQKFLSETSYLSLKNNLILFLANSPCTFLIHPNLHNIIHPINMNYMENVIRDDNIIALKEAIQNETFDINKPISVAYPIELEGSSHSMTYFEIAAQSGAKKCFSFLFAENAKISTSFQKWGVAEYAAAFNQRNMIQILNDNFVLNTESVLKASLFMHENDISLWLLHFNSAHHFDFIEIFKACIHSNNFEGIMLLLKFGANINEIDSILKKFIIIYKNERSNCFI